MDLSHEQLSTIGSWAERTRAFLPFIYSESSGKETSRVDSDVDLAVVVSEARRRDAYTIYFFQRDDWRSSLSRALGLTADIHLLDEERLPKVYSFVQRYGSLSGPEAIPEQRACY
jgi:hypothetical protein